ncbi:MAG: ATPase [Kaistia sp. SCN 65-12]|nr:MAG: ATPase [Kaistia sp. SCN 65-12]
MTPDRIDHTSFVIRRDFPARPAHAFRFWAEPDLKARWNDCHLDWTVLETVHEFRVGGLEAKRWRTPDDVELTFHAHYLDIEPARRILYAYRMSLAGKRLSASLVTIEFEPLEDRTRMTFTEQVALIGGGAGARNQRLAGTEEGFDRLAEILAGEMAVRH